MKYLFRCFPLNIFTDGINVVSPVFLVSFDELIEVSFTPVCETLKHPCYNLSLLLSYIRGLGWNPLYYREVQSNVLEYLIFYLFNVHRNSNRFMTILGKYCETY